MNFSPCSAAKGTLSVLCVGNKPLPHTGRGKRAGGGARLEGQPVQLVQLLLDLAYVLERFYCYVAYVLERKWVKVAYVLEKSGIFAVCKQ